jgi:hypothetical protein
MEDIWNVSYTNAPNNADFSQELAGRTILNQEKSVVTIKKRLEFDGLLIDKSLAIRVTVTEDIWEQGAEDYIWT